MSDATATEEYCSAHRHLGFDGDELRSLALMVFEAAFLTWPEKHALVAARRNELQSVTGETGRHEG